MKTLALLIGLCSVGAAIAQTPPEEKVHRLFRSPCGVGAQCEGCTTKEKNFIEDLAGENWLEHCEAYCAGYNAFPQCWRGKGVSRRGGYCLEVNNVSYWYVDTDATCKCVSDVAKPPLESC